MRLTAHEVDAIRSATREAFGDDVVVRLFGSRVRDDLKGGDIDLLLEVQPGRATLRREGVFRHALFARIEPRKLDVLLHERGSQPDAFVARAMAEGVPL